MNRVVHFEIGAEDTDRAIDFYEKVFGWKFENAQMPEDYWLIKAGEENEIGINGGLFRRSGMPQFSESNEDAINSIVSVDIEDIDESLDKVVDNGGEIVMAKVEVPQMGWSAYVRDTEGNIIGLWQSTEIEK